MIPRHQAREWAVQLLFQRDFNEEEEPAELDLVIEEFFADKPHHLVARAFAETLFRGVLDNLLEIDERLEAHTDNWRIERLGAVDRNVLRLAFHEFLHRPDIPPVVTIDEAITLAKELSDDKSGRFVNGVLDRASKTLTRPLRTPLPKDEAPGDPG